ncbi:exodeoxyribonuclease VII large subunit [Asticcacaulis sp. YBE204]|uniref:exodeoxyribonuclease VII large subunit n=1 Tax=Asticcacaulis sp. YBE204 TaxID=1282363 RepID=UPI0003C3B4CE|nr:exodeoxyribonuclease VII large subunit [Asticcacaulis sp. YBE204]ESQ77995.1 exodeoxyribonuclease VII large subunit [Asticcacaulis sp. YBE204]
MSDDLLSPVDSPSNNPPWSVSELAGALKRTIETAYDHVRVRAEVSKVTRHASGHVYLTLKDDRAAIDGVVWKGNVSRLKAQPQAGLEVIVTGKLTTFPASSKYQIVIESMEAAGVGALLAQLERIKAKLHSEGLFERERKKPLPFAPKTIGVITSPTGAVIRDILHRIRDRWPCRVVVWPVVVQGDTAAGQVIHALRGFQSGEAPQNPGIRPDVIIVARGGGSVEDLWAFNDENLARAVAACTIPVISAVGHETDTTLIDYVSDRRAPTPTGAAEMATPVLSELRGFLLDLERRRIGTFAQAMRSRQEKLALLSRALPKPQDLIDNAQQRLDYVSHRLGGGLLKNLNAHDNAFGRTSARFQPHLLERPRVQKADRVAQLSDRATAALMRGVERHNRDFSRVAARLTPTLTLRPLDLKREALTQVTARLDAAMSRRVETSLRQARLPQLEIRMTAAFDRLLALKAERVKRLDQLRVSLDPDRPLNLGFARVNRKDGALITSPDGVQTGDALELTFKGNRTLDVVAADGIAPPKPVAAPASKPRAATKPPEQGSLF